MVELILTVTAENIRNIYFDKKTAPIIKKHTQLAVFPTYEISTRKNNREKFIV